MKRKYLLLSFVLVCVLALINTTKVNSHIINPPYGSVGDPVYTTTCAQSGCHGSPTHAVTGQDLTLLIGTTSTPSTPLDNTFKYVGGQTYYINFNITPNAYAYGFQMTALDANNNMAGSFTVDTPNTTKILFFTPPAPAIDYIGHLHANNHTHVWQFQWTAPSKDSGAVTFYYAFNPGDSTNFVNNAAGSNIFVGQTTIQSSFNLGVNSIADKISALQIFPNPVNAAFNLAFNVKKAAEASAMVYSIDGKLCKELFNEKLNTGSFNRNYDISALPAGIYLVKLNIDGVFETRKITKE